MTLFYIFEVSIIFVCCAGIFYHKKYRFLGLRTVFFLFFLLFFGVAPLVQYPDRTSFFGGRSLTDSEYAIMAGIALIIVIGYYFLYHFFTQRLMSKAPEQNIDTDQKIKPVLVLSILFVCAISKLLLFKDNFYGLFLRSQMDIETSPISQIVNVCATIFPPTLLAIMLFKPKRENINLLLVVIAITAVTSFPLALNRTMIAAIYGSLLLVLIPQLRQFYLSVVGFLIFFLFLFPFFNQFRSIDPDWRSVTFQQNFLIFKEAHYDNFYNFALIVFDVPITWGTQLLSATLFFVPRQFWAEKAVGSGAYLARVEHMTFENLSSNFFAEGYVNFGFIGIVLFLLLIAFITSYFDTLKNLNKKKWKVLYLQCLFLFVIILRGDLMSSLSLTVSFVIINFIILKYCYKRT